MRIVLTSVIRTVDARWGHHMSWYIVGPGPRPAGVGGSRRARGGPP